MPYRFHRSSAFDSRPEISRSGAFPVAELTIIGDLESADESLLNPDTSSAGVSASDVIALKLNVDYADADLLPGIVDFGDLYICNTSNASLNGMTVRQFLAHANTLLGGGTGAPFTVAQASSIAQVLNGSFSDGLPSSVAQQNLFVGSCPCAP